MSYHFGISSIGLHLTTWWHIGFNNIWFSNVFHEGTRKRWISGLWPQAILGGCEGQMSALCGILTECCEHGPLAYHNDFSNEVVGMSHSDAGSQLPLFWHCHVFLLFCPFEFIYIYEKVEMVRDQVKCLSLREAFLDHPTTNCHITILFWSQHLHFSDIFLSLHGIILFIIHFSYSNVRSKGALFI